MPSENTLSLEKQQEGLDEKAEKLLLEIKDLRNSLGAGENIDLKILKELSLDWSLLDAESRKNANSVKVKVKEISGVLSEVHDLLNRRSEINGAALGIAALEEEKEALVLEN